MSEHLSPTSVGSVAMGSGTMLAMLTVCVMLAMLAMLARSVRTMGASVGAASASRW